MSEAAFAPLGILGGTFDPVHCAHLQLADDACKQLGLSQVLWIPSGNPPHREPPVASAEQRLAMTALAIKGRDNYVLDDSEVRSTARSYMVITLERLRGIYGKQPLALLLGVDAYLGLSTWHRWQHLFDLAHIAIATRPGYEFDLQQMDIALRDQTQRRLARDIFCLRTAPAGRVIPFAMTALDISASAIRAKLASGDATKHLLPRPVLDYIATNHLYS